MYFLSVILERRQPFPQPSSDLWMMHFWTALRKQTTSKKIYASFTDQNIQQLARPSTCVLSMFTCGVRLQSLADELTLSCFLLSCQLSSQTKWTSPVTKSGGEFMAPCRPGSPHPPASIPLHKPLQRRASVGADSRQRCRIRGIKHNCSIPQTSTRLKRFLPDLWHPQTACTFDFIRLTALICFLLQLRRK